MQNYGSMKTIFDQTTRGELINRINSLNEKSLAQWGKMDIYQMLQHCTLFDEMLVGKKKYKRAFIGRLFGKVALKDILKDEKPLNQNMPTLPELKIRENGLTTFDRGKWIAAIEEYEHFSNTGFVHSFFGKMTEAQIGHLAYKHADHHLRQFNS